MFKVKKLTPKVKKHITGLTKQDLKNIYLTIMTAREEARDNTRKFNSLNKTARKVYMVYREVV